MTVSPRPPDPTDVRDIAKEAYRYAFAMLENHGTWRKQAVDERAPEYVGTRGPIGSSGVP